MSNPLVEPPLPQDGADQRATLVAFLDHLRGVFAIKAAGLTEAQTRHSVVPSGWSIASMVKHLIDNERYWFAYRWAGLPDVPLDPREWELSDSDSIGALLGTYREVCAESNAIVAASPDLLIRSRRSENPPAAAHLPTLHWVLLHMIEETSRHAGHVDIARELIDGGASGARDAAGTQS